MITVHIQPFLGYYRTIIVCVQNSSENRWLIFYRKQLKINTADQGESKINRLMQKIKTI